MIQPASPTSNHLIYLQYQSRQWIPFHLFVTTSIIRQHGHTRYRYQRRMTQNRHLISRSQHSLHSPPIQICPFEGDQKLVLFLQLFVTMTPC